MSIFNNCQEEKSEVHLVLTETKNKDTLDAFFDALIMFADEAKTSSDLYRAAHHSVWENGRGKGREGVSAVLLAARGLREHVISFQKSLGAQNSEAFQHQ